MGRPWSPVTRGFRPMCVVGILVVVVVVSGGGVVVVVVVGCWCSILVVDWLWC